MTQAMFSVSDQRHNRVKHNRHQRGKFIDLEQRHRRDQEDVKRNGLQRIVDRPQHIRHAI